MVRAGLAYSNVAAAVDIDLEKAQKLAQKEKRGIWQEPFPKQGTKKGAKNERQR
jgi:endonuclease YncB( thermonuclease family)